MKRISFSQEDNHIPMKYANGLCTILIVDRNPNVRGYLKRELQAQGYFVRVADNFRDIFNMINEGLRIDLIIIDPDLPDAQARPLLPLLRQLHPLMPIVIHTHTEDDFNKESFLLKAIFVEKDGNSIERLMHVIHHLLAQ